MNQRIEIYAEDQVLFSDQALVPRLEDIMKNRPPKDQATCIKKHVRKAEAIMCIMLSDQKGKCSFQVYVDEDFPQMFDDKYYSKSNGHLKVTTDKLSISSFQRNYVSKKTSDDAGIISHVVDVPICPGIYEVTAFEPNMNRFGDHIGKRLKENPEYAKRVKCYDWVGVVLIFSCIILFFSTVGFVIGFKYFAEKHLQWICLKILGSLLGTALISFACISYLPWFKYVQKSREKLWDDFYSEGYTVITLTFKKTSSVDETRIKGFSFGSRN